ncbi:MAG TPA: hypothetical protein PK231_05785 [Acidocella sp.]|nr:hypothetical protein [Acidocella sp.]
MYYHNGESKLGDPSMFESVDRELVWRETLVELRDRLASLIEASGERWPVTNELLMRAYALLVSPFPGAEKDKESAK